MRLCWSGRSRGEGVGTPRWLYVWGREAAHRWFHAGRLPGGAEEALACGNRVYTAGDVADAYAGQVGRHPRARRRRGICAPRVVGGS